MSFWEAFAGGAGQGAGAGLFSGFYNDQMRTAADHSMDRADNSMREQMAYGERMSNTAHQREVSDLNKAGINPILTATGGPGASGGSPGSGTSGTMPTLENVGQKVISNAMEGMKMKASIQQMDKQNALLDAQADATSAQAAKTRTESGILGPEALLSSKVLQWFSNSGKTIKDAVDKAGDSFGGLKEGAKALEVNPMFWGVQRGSGVPINPHKELKQKSRFKGGQFEEN